MNFYKAFKMSGEKLKPIPYSCRVVPARLLLRRRSPVIMSCRDNNIQNLYFIKNVAGGDL